MERIDTLIENSKASIRAEYDDIVNIRERCIGIYNMEPVTKKSQHKVEPLKKRFEVD